MSPDSPNASGHLLLSTDYMAVASCRHGTFLFNRNDLVVGRSMELYGEWCEPELQILDQIIQPGAVVLDIGANIGTHTIPFARKVGDAGRVYAFEPQRLIFQTLCANVALNALRNVLTYHAGVSNVPGTMHLPVIDPRQPYNFGGVALQEHLKGEQLAVITIDELKVPTCQLIKIDVEGAEVSVLEGARKTIEQHRPVLFVENNTQDRSSSVIAAVQSLDYNAWWHFTDYYQPNNCRKNSRNVFLNSRPEANLLCFHRNHNVSLEGFLPVTGPEDDWLKALQRRTG